MLPSLCVSGGRGSSGDASLDSTLRPEVRLLNFGVCSRREQGAIARPQPGTNHAQAPAPAPGARDDPPTLQKVTPPGPSCIRRMCSAGSRDCDGCQPGRPNHSGEDPDAARAFRDSASVKDAPRSLLAVAGAALRLAVRSCRTVRKRAAV